MKSILALFALSLLTAVSATAAEVNTLTDAQTGKGWRLLFNGKDLTGWRTYREGGTIGEAWIVKDGILIKQGKVRGGDMMTTEAFGDFDLNWEWKIATNGNNGIKYFITRERKSPIGHEYQMLDDNGHPDGKKGEARKSAGFYDVLPAAKDKLLKKPGAWNHSRIFVRGDHVEHWLNGSKVLEYDCGSDEVLKAVQDSKFKKVKDFGRKTSGHLLLTDHGNECHFKNIRIREFK